MASNNRKRTSLSMEQKLDILHKLSNEIPVKAIACEYQIDTSTVRYIRKNATKIRQAAEGGRHVLKSKRIRKAKYEDLEYLLYLWFAERRAMGDPISDLILRQKALELMKEIASNQSNFKASTGWLLKFKNRYAIHLATLHGEKASADAVAAEKFISDFTRRIHEEGIEHSNIYNMDETGLTWKALPARTLVQNNEKQVGGTKIKKDRVSVGFCANMTGTHKLMPVFIHKYKKPRPIKNINNLPVVYKAQKNACMDHTIFTDWYQNHFQPAVRRYQLESRHTRLSRNELQYVL